MARLNGTLYIMTPIYPPAVGGAATYFSLLATELAVSFDSIRIYSEYNGAVSRCERNVRQLNLFPRRAGRERSIFDWPKYGIQNLLYLFVLLHLWWTARTRPPATILVHSSFFIYPNLLKFLMRPLRRLLPDDTMIVLDCRDRMMTGQWAGPERVFDRIICCSEQVRTHVETIYPGTRKIVVVPTPLDTSRFPIERVPTVDGFVLYYAGLIKREKGIGELIDCVQSLSAEDGAMRLRFAGHGKDVDIVQRANSISQVDYAGEQSNETVMRELSKCHLAVNPSFFEGLPRFTLEAALSGTPFITAGGIAEFERWFPDHCFADYDGMCEMIMAARQGKDFSLPEEQRRNIAAEVSIEGIGDKYFG